MRLFRLHAAIAAFFLALPLLALGGPPNGGPIAQLQAEVEDLTSRIEDLEANAPNSDPAGRTYCRTLSVTALGGDPVFLREAKTVLKQEAFFSLDMVTLTFNNISSTTAIQLQVGSGPLMLRLEGAGGEIPATYAKSGTQLDVIFPDLDTFTHHISKDGSLIYGSRIIPGLVDPVNTLAAVESTFVELVDGAECGESFGPGPPDM